MSGRQVIGALTIGQSPRTDVIPEIQEFLGGAEILQAGALDGLSRAEIDELYAALKKLEENCHD